MEFYCREVLPSSTFVCVSYGLGIIHVTHMLFHRLTDIFTSQAPPSPVSSRPEVDVDGLGYLVHRKLFTKEGGPSSSLHMARVTHY